MDVVLLSLLYQLLSGMSASYLVKFSKILLRGILKSFLKK